MRFVDTNILLYAVSKDPAERDKAAVAEQLLHCQDLVCSAQVLQEFYVQTTRPSRADRLSHEHAAGLVDAFRRFPVQEITTGVVLSAIVTADRFGISYWDAAIIEAARALECEVVLSEDLSAGCDYAGVSVLNPFDGWLTGEARPRAVSKRL